MGSVYVARHPHLGREVAVKFLAQEICAEPELAARFLAEARVTASLNHPNIVEILDFGEVDGELYYAMELLRGKSLRAVMREKGRLSGGGMKPYVEQICWALDAAHRAGIVHRDLKPANVIVLEGEPLRLKLLDFGVAKTMSAGPTQTRAGQVLGTATHMAPEQALGDPGRVTPQSDLYSLGAIAYEMLTGTPVFHHESDMMLMVMHVRDAVRPIREQAPDVPAAVARLIEACLAKDPAARPAGARAVAETLARALGNPDAEQPAPEAEAPVSHTAIADRPTRLASTAPPILAEVAPQPQKLAPRVTPPDAAEPPPTVIAPQPAAAVVAAQPAVVAPSPAAVVAPSPAAVVAPSPAAAPAPFAPRPQPAVTLVSPRAPAAPAARAPVAQVAPVPPAVAEDAEPSAEATIQTLLSRLQRRGDFPAFARTVGEVSHKADANGTFSAGQLGESILKDYALTAKLLRVVNANYARRFGGRIYSLQHAIVILGFDRVRSLALTISLFKTSGAGTGPERVSESAISALVSSEIARNLAGEARVSDDEATVCAMFKNLGRHLVLVYLPELYDRVQSTVEDNGVTVAVAAKTILGITFEDLGTAIAKSWQLPPHVVGAMSESELTAGKLDRNEDRLNALAAFANAVCDVVTRETAENRDQAVRRLLDKHKNLVDLDTAALEAILQQVEGSLNERDATLLGGDIKSSRFVTNVAAAAHAEPRKRAANAPSDPPVLVDPKRRQARIKLARPGAEPSPANEAAEAVPEADTRSLEERIAEVRAHLERGYPSDGVLGMALRIVGAEFGVRSPLILTAAPNRQHLVLRFGLREDLEGLRRELKFPLRAPGPRTQIFASAYHSGKDTLVKDCFEKETAETLPQSYFELLGSQSLAIYACLGKAVFPALLVIEADAATQLPEPARVAELAELRPLIARAAAR